MTKYKSCILIIKISIISNCINLNKSQTVSKWLFFIIKADTSISGFCFLKRKPALGDRTLDTTKHHYTGARSVFQAASALTHKVFLHGIIDQVEVKRQSLYQWVKPLSGFDLQHKTFPCLHAFPTQQTPSNTYFLLIGNTFVFSGEGYYEFWNWRPPLCEPCCLGKWLCNWLLCRFIHFHCVGTSL